MPDAPGPSLPVGLDPSCVAAFTEADFGKCCSILALQMIAMRTKQTVP
jgi:hypothetical protein